MKNNMKFRKWITTAVVIVSVGASSRLIADDNADAVKSLKEQIEQLDQKIRVLERKQELDKETADAKVKESPKINLGASGFSFKSGDSNFVVALQGVLQVDSRTFFKDGGIK